MEIKLNTNNAAVYSNKEANTETRNCLRLYGQIVWRQKSIFKVTKHKLIWKVLLTCTCVWVLKLWPSTVF